MDGDGQPLDGDQILTVLASQLKRSDQLAGDAVVVTVMSNLGFHDAMRESGIAVIETPVGDKHVYAAMRDGGYVLGGEQSGHIIQMGHATTGDGVLTGLHLLAAVNSIGIPVSAAGKMMTRYPQVLINVRGDKDRAMADPALAAAVSAAEVAARRRRAGAAAAERDRAGHPGHGRDAAARARRAGRRASWPTRSAGDVMIVGVGIDVVDIARFEAGPGPDRESRPPPVH